MSVTWFATAHGKGDLVAFENFKVIFTDKPKGIRLNASMTKRLLMQEIRYLRIGLEPGRLVIQPCRDTANGFKLIANKNSGQICSAIIGDWAIEQGLMRKRLKGYWDEEASSFIFELGGQSIIFADNRVIAG